MSPAVGVRPVFTYSFKNYGRTPGFITRLCSKFMKLPSFDKLPSHPAEVADKSEALIQEGGLPMPPGESSDAKYQALEGGNLTQDEYSAVREGRILLYGFVLMIYRDVYGREFTSSVGGYLAPPTEVVREWTFLRFGHPPYNKVT
jgi:hypothetical protein